MTEKRQKLENKNGKKNYCVDIADVKHSVKGKSQERNFFSSKSSRKQRHKDQLDLKRRSVEQNRIASVNCAEKEMKRLIT